MMNCSSCGKENRPGARFCDGCGAALAPRSDDDAVARKVVTIVFADLIGSTALHERLDAESTRRVMDGYYRALRSAVDMHGGTVVKLLGDGVMAAFGVPRVGEDDAIRAVRAAVAMQHAFHELVQASSGAMADIGLRVAVNTGEVVVSDDHADVVGDPVNVAARLQQEAHDGDVLIGESTRRLVGDLVTLAPFGDLALKGRSESVAAYRVVSLERPAGVAATAFVGRDDELRRVLAVYHAACAARAARLAVILGSPGLGKSRLLDEVARRLGNEATVLAARCDAAGGATFAPLAGALRALLRVDDASGGAALRAALDAMTSGDDAERSRVADGIAALLAATPASPEETFFIVRRFLAGLAGARPLVLAIDDVQWAEPLLFDLIEHLVQWSTSVPLFVLAAARPELRDTRAALATRGGLVAEALTLGGLDAHAATRLAANVIGAGELPAAIAGRVLATSEGNPLFVGELVRMLVHDGALKQEGDRWVAGTELAGLEMPPTIQALLAARIERLRPEERTVLERAAVVGRHFSRTAVAHLLPREVTDLDARLAALRRSELVEPDTGWFLGEPGLRFHHLLIRDAAYRRLLKGTRAELHGRFADWLETRVGDAVEHDETIGWHLEQAHQHLRELGPIDAQGRAFGERAARHLAAAGRRALARDDLPVAASLLGRALDRLDGADAAHADLALDRCEALLAAGDVGPAAQAIAVLGRFAAASDRLQAWHTCFAGQLAVLTDPQALRVTIDTVAAAAEQLAAAGDAAGEAKAHSVHALALARLGKIGACETALDKALAAARRAHDRRRANAVLAGAPPAALWGPSPVTRASGRCLDVVRVLRITQGAPAVEAVALRCQGVLEALRGRTEAARRMIASSRRMVEELGITQRLLEADVFAGLIELLDGDVVAAERCLRCAYDGLRRHGLGIDAAQAAALLGRALLAQGRAEEAEALSHESEALAGDDLKAAIAWRGVRAEALARRGEHTAAVELARAAVDIAAATDALLDHADARLALAVVLRAAGRRTEAGAEEARATELWETKGATLLAERARRDAGHLARAERATAAPAVPTRDTAAPPDRRVRANAATASAARVAAAIDARDLDTLSTLLAGDLVVVEHPTGVAYDRAGVLDSIRSLLSTHDLRFRIEPLATLGDSLGLFDRSVSTSGSAGDRNDAIVPIGIGAHEIAGYAVLEVDAQGRQQRAEFFARDRLGDAIVRSFERYAARLPDGPARARATATARSVALQLGPFGTDAMIATFASNVDFVDHRTLGFGLMRGAQAVLQRLRSLLEVSADIATRVDDVVDLRPDALLVHWTNFGTERVGGGSFEQHFLMLFVFGTDGLMTHNELFEADRDGEALARLGELTAAPRPAARFVNAAIRCMERFTTAWDARDWEAASIYAPGFRLIDRRTTVHLDLDREQHIRDLRPMFDMSSSRFTLEPFATRGDRLALVRARFESSGGSVGPSEAEWLQIVEVDAAGDCAAMAMFDLTDVPAAHDELDRRYAALVRYDEITAGATSDARIENAATRSAHRFDAAWDAGDWARLTAIFGPHYRESDRRRMVQLELDRDAYLKGLRLVFAMRPSRHTSELLATRGDRLALFRTRCTGGGGAVGPTEAEWLGLVELDERGRRVAGVIFDPDDLDAAYAELDERYATGEAASHRRAALTRVFSQAFAERQWGTLAALLAPDLVVNDHRPLGWESLHGPAAYIEALQALIDLAPDVRLRIDHITMRGARFLYLTTFVGTHEGGAFETPSAIVCELDEVGRIRRFDQYALDQLDQARAQVDALRNSSPPASPCSPGDPFAELATPNLATAAADRVHVAFATRDWRAMRDACRPDARIEDRRGHAQLAGDADWWVADARGIAETMPDLRYERRLVATAGGRIAVERILWASEPTGGQVEVEYFGLTEVDASGQIAAIIAFDLDDLRGVKREAWERWLAVDVGAAALLRPLLELTEAFNAHDLARVRRVLDDDVVVDDHRLTGQGRTEGAAAFVDVLTGVWNLVPDVEIDPALNPLAIEPYGSVTVGRDVGTFPEGGVFERHRIVVTTVAGARINQLEFFDLDDVDAALACLRELRPDPLRIPPNAAMRAGERVAAARQAQAWDVLESLCAPDLELDDRRRSFLTSGDRTTFIAMQRFVGPRGARSTHTTLATWGDRLALDQVLWSGSNDGPACEVEALQITEVDTHGRIVAVIVFDPDDRRAASVEMFERHARREARHPAAVEFTRAIRDQDLARCRALLSEGFVFHDHRRTGVGRVDEPDGYIRWLASLFEAAPGALFEPLYHLASESHGVLAVARTFGVGAQSGEFESVYVQLILYRGDRLIEVDLYEPEDLDVARARFEALRPAP